MLQIRKSPFFGGFVLALIVAIVSSRFVWLSHVLEMFIQMVIGGYKPIYVGMISVNNALGELSLVFAISLALMVPFLMLMSSWNETFRFFQVRGQGIPEPVVAFVEELVFRSFGIGVLSTLLPDGTFSLLVLAIALVYALWQTKDAVYGRFPLMGFHFVVGLICSYVLMRYGLVAAFGIRYLGILVQRAHYEERRASVSGLELVQNALFVITLFILVQLSNTPAIGSYVLSTVPSQPVAFGILIIIIAIIQELVLRIAAFRVFERRMVLTPVMRDTRLVLGSVLFLSILALVFGWCRIMGIVDLFKLIVFGANSITSVVNMPVVGIIAFGAMFGLHLLVKGMEHEKLADLAATMFDVALVIGGFMFGLVYAVAMIFVVCVVYALIERLGVWLDTKIGIGDHIAY